MGSVSPPPQPITLNSLSMESPVHSNKSSSALQITNNENESNQNQKKSSFTDKMMYIPNFVDEAAYNAYDTSSSSDSQVLVN